MNSLYNLCEYGYKIQDIEKLKKTGTTIEDICNSKLNNYNRLYQKAQKIYKKNSDVFKHDSIYELYEYGISIRIIDSIKNKVTIEEIRKFPDKYLKEKYDIKYNTLSKIRKCGYFGYEINEIEDNNKILKKTQRLKEYGISQTTINKMIDDNIKMDELLYCNTNEIMKKLGVSKATASKIEMGLKNYKICNQIKEPLDKVLSLYFQEESKYCYIPIEKIQNQFKDYNKEEVETALKKLTDNEIIENKDNSYRYHFLTLEKLMKTIKEEKLKDIIELKLRGINGQEIGDKYGISRERVRQKISKFISNNIVKEDIYRDIVKEYQFSQEEFMIIFEETQKVYEYLNLKYKYQFREKDIKQFIEDYPEYVTEEKNEKLLSLNKEIIYNNNRIKLNYTEIIKEYVKKMETTKNLKEILKELNEDLEKLELQSINERYLEMRLSKIDNVVLKSKKMYKYIDYTSITEEKKLILKNTLEDLPDGYYSTLKLYKQNKEFFEDINIEDEYEAHNLLRKLFNEKIPNVTFYMMPSFLIGEVEIEQFFFNLIKEHEPIKVTDFINLVEEKYGHKKAHIRNIISKYFNHYINLDKINIKTILLEEDKIIELKSKMKKELYNIESFYEILKQLYQDNYLEYINNTNINHLGYHLIGNYILDNKYDTLESYIKDTIDKHDFYFYDNEFCTSTYNMVLRKLETQYDIIKINENKYITKKKLEEIGITKELIYDFIELIENNIRKNEFFTLYSIENTIETSAIYQYGFDDIFYESILSSYDFIRTARFQNKTVMVFSEKQSITHNDIVVSLLKEKRGYSIEELITILNKKYGIEVDRLIILNICYDEGLYYNKELEKIYLNKEQWYEEVY